MKEEANKKSHAESTRKVEKKGMGVGTGVLQLEKPDDIFFWCVDVVV